MHLTLLVLAYLTNKFLICKDILSKEDLVKFLKVYSAIQQAHGQVFDLESKLEAKKKQLRAVQGDQARAPGAEAARTRLD